jgi:hypothetical protein
MKLNLKDIKQKEGLYYKQIKFRFKKYKGKFIKKKL